MMNNGTQNGPAISPAEGGTPTPHVQVLDRSGQVQHSVALTQDGLTAGRRDDHLLALKGDGIGRTHLRIDWDGSRATVTQLSEQHTTWLNQIALHPFEAQVWEVEQPLQVGAYQLRLIAPARRGRRPRPTRINSERIGVAIESGATLTLTPGKSEVVRLKLTNRAKTTDDLHLSIEGIPESWIQFTARVVQVPYGEQKIALTVSIPDEPESRAGPYTVTVYARSGENPDELAGASAYWTIAPFTRCRMEINPSKAYGRRQAAYTIAVWNEGNEPADYKITTGDDTSTLVYDFTPPQITVEPGERQEVNLQVQSDRRFTGAPQTYNFSIRATQRGSRVANEQAQFVHQAYVPTWGIPFGATSLFLLLAMLLWLFGTLPGVPRTPQTLALGYARLNPTATATPTVRGAPTASTRTPEATPNNEQETALVLTAVVRSGQTATAVWLGQDDDHDTILNGLEISTVGSLPDARDTDSDGLDDDTEIALGTNPRKSDSDGDGLKDGDEISTGLNPMEPDSDGDGLPDPQDPYTPPLPTPTPTSVPTDTPIPTAVQQPGGTGGSGGTSGTSVSGSATPLPTNTPTATNTPTPIPDNQAPAIGVPEQQNAIEDIPLGIEGITIGDPDAKDATILVSLTAPNGTLTVTSEVGLSFQDGTTNGTSKVIFKATIADAQRALRDVVYKGKPNYTGSDTITLMADDQGNTGQGGPKKATKTIAITLSPVNDAPKIASDGLSIREGGSNIITDAMLEATDVDDTPNRLTFTIARKTTRGKLWLGDRELGNGGKFTQEDINDGLLSYTHNGDGISADSFDFTLKDASDGRIGQTTFTISFTENRPPTLDLDNSVEGINYNPTAGFTEGGASAPIVAVGKVIVEELDGDLIDGATITLEGVKDGESEALAVNVIEGGVKPDYKYNSGPKTGVLTLTGKANKTVYQNILNSAVYVNTADNPNNSPRTIKFVIKDDLGKSSAVAITTLPIELINSPPRIRVNGTPFIYTEHESPQLIADNAVVDDADNPSNYNGASLVVSIDNPQALTDQFSIKPGNDIDILNDTENTITFNSDIIGTFSYLPDNNQSTIQINFTEDDATIEAVRALTQRIAYRSTSKIFVKDHIGAARTVHFVLTDKEDTSENNRDEATRPLQIKGVNDAPVLDPTKQFTMIPIDKDAVDNNGMTVAEIINTAGNGAITDPDTTPSGSVERGIAITNCEDTNGEWQYLIEGGIWTNIPNPGSNQAFRLASTARIRFKPNANYTMPNRQEFHFRAWDQSDGADENGKLGAITINDTSAYSRDADEVALTFN